MNVLEVGANTGSSTLSLLNRFPGANFYLFEPTHELLTQHLWPKFGAAERVRVLPFAVDIENSFKEFNVAGQCDWGCSSLHKFSKNIHEKWPNRPDFKITHSYFVPTIRLKDFCILYGIDTIDYLWIDTQGNDLNVLMSLEEKIEIVKEGCCEAAWGVELYEDTNNTLESVLEFLKLHNFETSFGANDTINAEANVMFKRAN